MMINFENLTPPQEEIVDIVAVTALDLLMDHRFSTLIDPVDGYTGELLDHTAKYKVGPLVRGFMGPEGAHQSTIVDLRIQFGEYDRKCNLDSVAQALPVERVTARLGSKATSYALAQFNRDRNSRLLPLTVETGTKLGAMTRP